MSTTEIVLNMLAETSATDISKAEQPATFEQNRDAARQGGEVAGIARRALEERTGKPVITSMKASYFHRLLPEILENAAYLSDKEEKATE